MNEYKQIGIESLKGIGPKKAQLFRKMGIESLYDLIHHYPFRYKEYEYTNMESAKDGEHVLIYGKVVGNVTSIRMRNRKQMLKFMLENENGFYQVSLFNRNFLKSNIQNSEVVTVGGKYKLSSHSIVASDIFFKKLSEDTIEPIYPSTDGLSSKKIHEHILETINSVALDLFEELPNEFIEKHQLMSLHQAIEVIHNPKNKKMLASAINRIKYNEFFDFGYKMKLMKEKNKVPIKKDYHIKSEIEAFKQMIPFELTSDQLKVLKEIEEDFNSNHLMHRLVQGDVGSGKTVVSMYGIYLLASLGYQCAFMAPTEILAKQQFYKMIDMFEPLGLKVEMLLRSLKAKEKKIVYEQLSNNEINIIVGTHALIQERVEFNNLKFAVIDEQHRFGVKQRETLREKGHDLNIMYLSATPIPRTLALSIFSDLDVSTIKTKPLGRREVLTKVLPKRNIKQALNMITHVVDQNQQVYVVVPLVNDSENMDLYHVDEMEKNLNTAFNGKVRIKSLHGQMSPSEKDEVMYAFKHHEFDVLVSTTVIEVGVDVKNATLMIIFDSERFGLSQLHQLRGRVGRNDLQSYCLLISNSDAERLSVMEKTNDGFEISEEDLKLRGPGDLFGIRQSGVMVFRQADLVADHELYERVRVDVEIAYEKHLLSKQYVKYLEDRIVSLG